jgi:hypothetical protein
VPTDFDSHIPEAIFEEFAMEMLSEKDCAMWEEHLLICAVCQDRLAETDEYIQLVKDAAAISDSGADDNTPPATEFGKRRSLAKPMMAATHAALLLAVLLRFAP